MWQHRISLPEAAAAGVYQLRMIVKTTADAETKAGMVPFVLNRLQEYAAEKALALCRGLLYSANPGCCKSQNPAEAGFWNMSRAQQ